MKDKYYRKRGLSVYKECLELQRGQVTAIKKEREIREIIRKWWLRRKTCNNK